MKHVLAGMMVLFVISPDSFGQNESKVQAPSFFDRESLTGGFFGLNDAIEEKGLTVGLGLTQIYQQNMKGGMRTSDRSGRYTGSYDLELEADMESILGVEGARVYLLAEGAWPGGGIDEESVGSAFGVNTDAMGEQSIGISELWWEQSILDNHVLIRFGKMDLTCGFQSHDCPLCFDGNLYANDETHDFLNGSLINNPTIPFPDYALGAAVLVRLTEEWYLSAAGADAQADGRETGFSTAFHEEDYFFGIFETGLTPEWSGPNGSLAGAYRVGVWYDPQGKERFKGTSMKRDDMGLYVSLEQNVFRENSDDSQGLGVFGRYGWSGSESGPDEELVNFWSAGISYQGLVPGRNEDVLGCGVAQGYFSDQSEMTEDSETAGELYYNVQVTGWMQITPSVQYIADTGGTNESRDAIIGAVRVQMNF